MKGLRMFVTGAAGYIGGSVAARLVAAGHVVTGLVRDGDRGGVRRALRDGVFAHALFRGKDRGRILVVIQRRGVADRREAGHLGLHFGAGRWMAGLLRERQRRC